MRGYIVAIHINGAGVRTGNPEKSCLESSRNRWCQDPLVFTLTSWILSVVTPRATVVLKNYMSTSEF